MIKLKDSEFLVCERRIIFLLLMLSAGMMGAYTFNMRGGVFCNAQTANFVIMAVTLGKGMWREGLYYLIPITAYFSGAVISEVLPKPVKKIHFLRWDTYLVGFEIAVLILCGFIPLTVTNHVVQVLINFICSMQYNTFRQAEHVPMATTFCTNHLRQTGIWLVKYIKERDGESLLRLKSYAAMIAVFVTGAIAETGACLLIKEKAIWLAVAPMLICFIIMSYADLFAQKEKLDEIPSGH